MNKTIKDTSITDYGAFNLMIHCDRLETLEYSQDTFLQQLLWRISQNYSVTKTMFGLKSLFLLVNKPSMLVNVVRSLPRLEVVGNTELATAESWEGSPGEFQSSNRAFSIPLGETQ